MVGMSENLFLKRFPEEKALWTINQQRVEGFLKFTKKAKNEAISSIDMKSAKQIASLNALGFITVDSQEGIIEITENPKYVYGKKKGQSIVNEEGSPAVLYKVSERAYCDGFIRTDLLDSVEEELKKCNPDSIVLRYPREGDRINLTIEYLKYKDGSEKTEYFTNSPDVSADEIKNYAKDILEDNGYYNGPPLEKIPLDLSKWTMIIAIDMEYGHHALVKDGLFTCLEHALTASLKGKGGSRKRRTMKKRVKSLRNNKA